MNDTPDFSKILDTQVTDAEPPKPFPAGSYVCVVKGLPKMDKSTKKGTPYVEFTLQPVEAKEDVDEEELEEFGALSEKTLRVTYYITEEAKYRLRKFLEDCGIEVEGRTFTEAINDAPGQSVIAIVKHTPSQNPGDERVFAEVTNTMRA